MGYIVFLGGILSFETYSGLYKWLLYLRKNRDFQSWILQKGCNQTTPETPFNEFISQKAFFLCRGISESVSVIRNRTSKYPPKFLHRYPKNDGLWIMHLLWNMASFWLSMLNFSWVQGIFWIRLVGKHETSPWSWRLLNQKMLVRRSGVSLTLWLVLTMVRSLSGKGGTQKKKRHFEWIWSNLS